MSNPLAIAAVTATLRDLLQEVVSVPQWGISGAEVTVRNPAQIAKDAQDKPAVNLFLYQTSPNSAWRNFDLPARNGDGKLRQDPIAALDLHYLLSFYGDESAFEPQRLLGSVIAVLHARPVLSQKLIARTLQTAARMKANGRPLLDESALKDSDLSEQVELVRLVPTTLSLEDLSKLWSAFQTPYALSVTYQASVVLIEMQDVPEPPLPVHQVRTRVSPGFRQAASAATGSEIKIERVPETTRLSKGLQVTLEQPVGKGQRVTLLLNEFAGDNAYELQAPAVQHQTAEITFRLSEEAPSGQKERPLVQPGEYLVRVRVDGTESGLDWDAEIGFRGPKVEIKP